VIVSAATAVAAVASAAAASGIFAILFMLFLPWGQTRKMAAVIRSGEVKGTFLE
jgi:hypothetical protein